MKKTTTFLCICFSTLTFGQLSIDNTIFVNNGGLFYADVDLDITVNGLLHVEGSLVLDGELTGDNLLQLEPTASLTLNNGTLVLDNETDEEFANLALGAAGFLEIPAGNSLTLSGDLDNQNAGQGIKLLADANGTYGQLLTTGTITNKGTTYAEQYFSAATNPGWRQFGSPVSATFAQVDDDFQTYYPNAPGTVGTADQWNIHYWEASYLSGNTAGTPAKGWTTVDNNALPLGPKGYTMYSGGAFDILNNGILDLAGEIGNGDYGFLTYPTTATVVQSPENTGWKLIPNPYPSNIDVSALLADGASFLLAYKAVHVWDAKTQQYQAITDDVAISTGFTGPTSATTTNIAPFQAFWVKGGTTAPQPVYLKNTHRTIVAQGNFFKTAPQLIRLNASAPNGDIDQTILTFEELASDDLEDRDAFKIRSLDEAKPSLYTRVEGAEISINRLEMPKREKHIPLFFEQKEVKEFTINMVEATVDMAWMIELEDHKTGAIHNLRDDVYTFVNDPSFSGNRFTVHINKTGESISSINGSRIAIFANDHGINVAFGYFTREVASANVLITNLAGQTYFNGTVSTDQAFVFPVNGPTNLYVVHVTAGDKVEVGKVVK